MPKKPLGIRSQLIAGIVITTIAGMGLIGLFSVIAVERMSVYWKAAEAEKLVRVVRVYFRASGGFNNPESGRVAATALKEAGVEAFELTDPAGRSWASSGALGLEEGEEIFDSAEVSVRRVGAGWLYGPGRLLYVSAPLTDSHGVRGGRLAFSVSLRDMRQETAGIRRLLLIYALFDSFIIIGLGVYFLSRSITIPIRALTAAATRIAGGSLGERVRVQADNEIGSLAQSFNVMADKLEAEIMALERVNAELVSTQGELLRSTTLAAIGNLAAGIAHEVGNPLGALSGYLDILRRGATDKEEEDEILRRAIAELGRIDAIVRDFLDVSRPPSAAKTPVDLNGVALEAVAAASVHPAFAGVKTETYLKDVLPLVAMDEGKLRQVFVNLLLNAAQSMQDTGGVKTVTVETSAEIRLADAVMQPKTLRRKEDRFLGRAERLEKEYVTISFADRGAGISEQDVARIFEPFFTTKGGGTGLGLFVSHSIVKAYGGEIIVQSRPGQGSTFTVVLPADEQEIE